MYFPIYSTIYFLKRHKKLFLHGTILAANMLSSDENTYETTFSLKKTTRLERYMFKLLSYVANFWTRVETSKGPKGEWAEEKKNKRSKNKPPPPRSPKIKEKKRVVFKDEGVLFLLHLAARDENKNKLCSMTCGGILQAEQRWRLVIGSIIIFETHMYHAKMRLKTSRLSFTLWFQNGVWPPSPSNYESSAERDN